MRIIYLLLFLLLSCGAETSGDQKVSGLRSGKAKWSSALSSPLTIRVDSDLETRYGADIYTTIDQLKSTWDVEVPGINFFESNSSLNQISDPNFSSIESYFGQDSGDPSSFNWGIYLREEGSWFSSISSSSLAVTQYFGFIQNAGSTGEFLEIIHADIFINEDDFDFSLNPNHLTQYHLPTVILHELGHFLGLTHSFSSSDVMFPSLGPYNSNTGSGDKTILSSGDVSAIHDLYSTSALSSSSGRSISAASTTSDHHDKVLIRGVIELRENGDCVHFENGKQVYKHKRH